MPLAAAAAGGAACGRQQGPRAEAKLEPTNLLSWDHLLLGRDEHASVQSVRCRVIHSEPHRNGVDGFAEGARWGPSAY